MLFMLIMMKQDMWLEVFIPYFKAGIHLKGMTKNKAKIVSHQKGLKPSASRMQNQICYHHANTLSILFFVKTTYVLCIFSRHQSR